MFFTCRTKPLPYFMSSGIVFVYIYRLMSLFRQRTDRGSSNLGALEECVCDFVLRSR